MVKISILNKKGSWKKFPEQLIDKLNLNDSKFLAPIAMGVNNLIKENVWNILIQRCNFIYYIINVLSL